MARFCGIILFFLSAVSLTAEDVIPLETLPPAAFRWTWTAKGMKELVRNTNLDGLPVRIAGKEYKRAITGHAPTSHIYHLDGKAIRFRAEIGMDDASSRIQPDQTAKSSVFAEIIVDRRCVFRRELRPDEKAVPVEIDLRGKQQLELRGNYGDVFTNQNIVWCNPELTVVSEPEFLRTAERWRAITRAADSHAPVYPDAPDWKTIRISKITFGSFRNAYRIATSGQELIIVPEFGGRILHYSVPGGKNLLYHKNDPQRLTTRMIRGRAGDFAGGHFQRFDPVLYFYPSDPVLKHGCYQIEFPAEGEIVMRSAPCPVFFLQYEYRLTIMENQVRIQNILVNTAAFPQKLANWPITRVDMRRVRKLEMSDGSKIENDKEFQQKIRTGYEIRKQAERVSYTLTAEDGSVFRMTFDPPGKNGLHVFFNTGFAELESHAPLKTLPPDGKNTYSEWWRLE